MKNIIIILSAIFIVALFYSSNNQFFVVQAQTSADVTVDATQRGVLIDSLVKGINDIPPEPTADYAQWYERQYYDQQIGVNGLVRIQFQASWGQYLSPNPNYDPTDPNSPEMISDYSKLDPVLAAITQNNKIPLITFSGLPNQIPPRYLAGDPDHPCETGPGAWPCRSTSPPADYDLWQQWVYDSVYHWTQVANNGQGYNFYLGIWNEPESNLFWRGSQSEMFELYAYSVSGARQANPSQKIGGLDFVNYNSSFRKNFLDLIKTNQLVLDFLTWHTYDYDPNNPYRPYNPAESDPSQSDAPPQVILGPGYENIELFIDEWNWNATYNSLPRRDTHEQAVLIADRLKEFLDLGIDRQAFFFLSDTIIPPEMKLDTEFAGDFGIFTKSGIIKPSFNAHLVFSKVSGQRLTVNNSSEIRALSSISGNKIFVLLWNGNTTMSTSIQINNLPYSGLASYELNLIDGTHSNSWAVQNKFPQDIITFREDINNWPEVKLYREVRPTTISNNNFVENITLMPHSLVLITLDNASRPIISLSKTADKTSVGSGESVTYTITYNNSGLVGGENIKIEDYIPYGTAYLTSGGQFDGNKIVWNLGNLAPGTSGSVQFQVRVE